MEKQNATLEESFGELEKILQQLDKSDITLEESFDLYTKGMELIKVCNSKIETVEKKLRIIGEEQDGI